MTECAKGARELSHGIEFELECSEILQSYAFKLICVTVPLHDLFLK